jgi:hypothetical protein
MILVHAISTGTITTQRQKRFFFFFHVYLRWLRTKEKLHDTIDDDLAQLLDLIISTPIMGNPNPNPTRYKIE